VDPSAIKPIGWLDDIPSRIPDPTAQKPEDWDDELDGEFDPPLVDNPACDRVGCGQWEPPRMVNPAYKGKWKAPLIDNPAYKGVWKPRQIPNPNFFVDNEPHKLPSMGAVGFELWTMQEGVEFDNIFIGTSEHAAEALGAEHWKPKFDAQSAAELAKHPQPSIINDITQWLTTNWIAVLVTIGVILASLTGLIMCCCETPRNESNRAPIQTNSAGAPRTQIQTNPLAHSEPLPTPVAEPEPQETEQPGLTEETTTKLDAHKPDTHKPDAHKPTRKTPDRAAKHRPKKAD